jgi:hypothetical protein
VRRLIAVDSPEVAAAKRLIDALREQGFSFSRIAPGEDAPVRGTRDDRNYSDEIYVAGFSHSCTAIRRSKSSLIIPGGLPVVARLEGDALTVLHVVATEWHLSP